jgi:hypothetical protein
MSISGYGPLITPLASSGDEVTAGKRKGVFTLTASTTYYYVWGGAASPTQHIHLTGYTSGLVITSATIQTCSQPSSVVSDVSSTVGEWINEDPADGDVRTDGTGWSSLTAIAAANGTGVGGASWHLRDWGALRTRLEVVVGGTGGDVSVAWAGKE